MCKKAEKINYVIISFLFIFNLLFVYNSFYCFKPLVEKGDHNLMIATMPLLKTFGAYLISILLLLLYKKKNEITFENNKFNYFIKKFKQFLQIKNIVVKTLILTYIILLCINYYKNGTIIDFLTNNDNLMTISLFVPLMFFANFSFFLLIKDKDIINKMDVVFTKDFVFCLIIYIISFLF